MSETSEKLEMNGRVYKRHPNYILRDGRFFVSGLESQDISIIWDALNAADTSRERVEELEMWLSRAKCPADCVDKHYPSMPDGEPQACEFCHERDRLLAKHRSEK